MVQTIGFMIGAYIFTRMLETIVRKDSHLAVVICAVLTMIVVAFGVFALLMTPSR